MKIPNISQGMTAMDLAKAAEQLRKAGLTIKQVVENSTRNMKQWHDSLPKVSDFNKK